MTPDRALPEFPESPWSRVLKVEGNDEDGWVFKMRPDDREIKQSNT